MMNKFFLAIALLLASTPYAQAQAPDALAVQLAMNEGLEREFPTFQEYTDIQIIRGGQTHDGNYLFLCNGRLMWKMNSTDFSTLLKTEINEMRPEAGQDDTLWRAVALTLSARLTRIGEFAAGGTVNKVRSWVRLEKAGTDWIVTDAKIKYSDSNPLYIIDKAAQ